MRVLLCAAAVLLAAAPAAAQPRQSLFAPGETLHAAGAEPFWGAEIRGPRMRLTTPADERARSVRVLRSEAKGRVVFTGATRDGPFSLTVSAGRCSDGMSERTYPLTVRMKFRTYTMNGCAWTARRPFRGEG